jgi:hypothetical protein
MLDAANPESHSGACEWNHVYQNQEVVTLVCWSEHKGKTTQYHKSKSDSKIDRGMCKPEFYLINKLIGLLQIASACERVLRTVDKDKLPERTSAMMQWVRSYTGNIETIPNEHAARKNQKVIRYQMLLQLRVHLALLQREKIKSAGRILHF